MDTSAGNAAASQILSGKKAYVGGNLVTGSMLDKSGTTVTAGSVTQDSSYTYFGVPSSGYYSTGSKLRALNSNLAGNIIKPSSSEIASGSQSKSKSFAAEIGKYYLVMCGHLANTGSSSYMGLSVTQGGTIVSQIKWKSGVNSSWEGKASCAVVKATATTITMNQSVNHVCLTDF